MRGMLCFLSSHKAACRKIDRSSTLAPRRPVRRIPSTPKERHEKTRLLAECGKLLRKLQPFEA